MKNSSALRNARRVSVAAVLAGGCLAGNAVAQQQMRRVTEAPAAPPPPANTIAKVAPVAPPAFPPGPPTKPAGAAARVAPAAAAPVPAGRAPLGREKMASGPVTMNHGGLAPNRMYVPFPAGMTNTVDSKVCTQHGGFAAGLGCTGGIPNGMLALVWNCPNCKVDGYHLYRVDGGKHEAVTTPANGAAFTAALLDAPQGGFNGRCYAAAAYRGANESDLSNPYCASGGSVVVTDIFKPDHVRSSIDNAMTGSGLMSTSSGDLTVGASHTTEKHNYGDMSTNSIARGALHFDVSKLSQRHIMSATLHVSVDTTFLDSGGIDHGTSCASEIALGADRWWEHGDWILAAGQLPDPGHRYDTPASLQPGSASGPDATYDITPIVSDWALGKEPNVGVVLMTNDKVIDGFSENACYTTYTPTITLEVKSWG
jgi:hypothetical protein